MTDEWLISEVFSTCLNASSFEKSKTQLMFFSVFVQEKEKSPKVEPMFSKKEVNRKCKIYECPDLLCQRTYKDHKTRLVDHVEAQHPDSADTLLKKIKLLYPTKTNEISSGLVCDVCRNVISGSSTHLENHYKRQVNNSKLSVEIRQDYSLALERLQDSVKRRKRAVKAIDNRTE